MGRRKTSEAEKDFMATTSLKEFNKIMDDMLITETQKQIARMYYFNKLSLYDISNFPFKREISHLMPKNATDENDVVYYSPATISRKIRDFALKLACYQREKFSDS